jgi:hypothetical protein
MSHSELSRLASLARGAASSVPDPPADLANAIRSAAGGPADPWLLIGVMIEGIAHTMGVGIPSQRHADCTAAAVKLLLDRMRQRGAGRSADRC